MKDMKRHLPIEILLVEGLVRIVVALVQDPVDVILVDHLRLEVSCCLLYFDHVVLYFLQCGLGDRLADPGRADPFPEGLNVQESLLDPLVDGLADYLIRFGLVGLFVPLFPGLVKALEIEHPPAHRARRDFRLSFKIPAFNTRLAELVPTHKLAVRDGRVAHFTLTRHLVVYRHLFWKLGPDTEPIFFAYRRC
jgi:hypothetical protein